MTVGRERETRENAEEALRWLYGEEEFKGKPQLFPGCVRFGILAQNVLKALSLLDAERERADRAEAERDALREALRGWLGFAESLSTWDDLGAGSRSIRETGERMVSATKALAPPSVLAAAGRDA